MRIAFPEMGRMGEAEFKTHTRSTVLEVVVLKCQMGRWRCRVEIRSQNLEESGEGTYLGFLGTGLVHINRRAITVRKDPALEPVFRG